MTTLIARVAKTPIFQKCIIFPQLKIIAFLLAGKREMLLFLLPMGKVAILYVNS